MAGIAAAITATTKLPAIIRCGIAVVPFVSWRTMFRKNAQQLLLQVAQQLGVFVEFLLVPGICRRESPAAPGHLLVLGANVAQPLVGIQKGFETHQGAAHSVFEMPNKFLFDLLVQNSDPSKNVGTICGSTPREAPLTHSSL